MDAYYGEIIKSQAEKIKQKLKGGQLFGIPIGELDSDGLLVAAYNMGFTEEMTRSAKEKDRIFELFGTKR